MRFPAKCWESSSRHLLTLSFHLVQNLGQVTPAHAAGHLLHACARLDLNLAGMVNLAHNIILIWLAARALEKPSGGGAGGRSSMAPRSGRRKDFEPDTIWILEEQASGICPPLFFSKYRFGGRS